MKIMHSKKNIGLDVFDFKKITLIIYYIMDSELESWMIVAGIIVLLLVVYYIYYFSTLFTDRQITVKSDFTQANGKRSINLIGTTDGKVYKISNNVFIGFFKASEVLATLEEGQTYIVSGYGKRISMLGMYPQITITRPV